MDDMFLKALSAESETAEVEFKREFKESTRAWCEIVKDIVAIANSGGGVIVFGLDDIGNPSGKDVRNVSELDPAKVADKIQKYTDSLFAEFQISQTEKRGEAVVILRIFRSDIPMVFTRPGTYPIGNGHQNSAFSQGTVYFRHGAKSQPGTQDDIRKAVSREVEARREFWLSNIRKVVEAPINSEVVLVPPNSDSKRVTQVPIQIVTDDANAAKYRKLDPDVTHPYRLTEVVEIVNEAIDDREVNSYDLISINKVHGIKKKEAFCHDPKFSSPQYSTAFVDWIVEKYEEDDDFFDKAREGYYEIRYGRKRGER